jgi:hypothetical protein
MKIIILIFLSFIQSVSIYSQNTEKFKESTIDFFKSVTDFTKDFNRSNIDNLLGSRQYTDEEINRLLEEYYKVKAEDPEGFARYQHLERNEFEDRNKTSPHTKELMVPEKIGIIYRIIVSKYGKHYTDLFLTPWFLKVKVIDIKGEKLNIPQGPTSRAFLLAEVQDVIKGEKKFANGEIIHIYFLSDWLHNKKFEKNKSYFVPLKQWNCKYGDCEEVGLVMFPDNNWGVYPIENNEVIAPNNYFGFSDKMDWINFRKNFINQFILFK